MHRRSYFYAGGTFVQQGSSTLVHGQVYVEHLVPAMVTQPFLLIFIEGQGMTGINLLNTPDGRTGWADYFMSKGYEVCSYPLHDGRSVRDSDMYLQAVHS